MLQAGVQPCGVKLQMQIKRSGAAQAAGADLAGQLSCSHVHRRAEWSCVGSFDGVMLLRRLGGRCHSGWTARLQAGIQASGAKLWVQLGRSDAAQVAGAGLTGQLSCRQVCSRAECSCGCRSDGVVLHRRLVQI